MSVVQPDIKGYVSVRRVNGQTQVVNEEKDEHKKTLLKPNYLG